MVWNDFLMAFISVFVVLPSAWYCRLFNARRGLFTCTPLSSSTSAHASISLHVPLYSVVVLHATFVFFLVPRRREMAGPPAPARAVSGTTPLPADEEEAAKKARIVLAWKAVATLSTRQEAMVYIKSRGFSIFRHSHDTSVARCTKHAQCVAGNGAHLRIKPAKDGLGNVRALSAMGCTAFSYAVVLIR